MTNQEVIEECKKALAIADRNDERYIDLLITIIKALEQEPCEDCISRQAVLDMMQMRISGKELYKAVYDLPSVTPQPKTGHWIGIDEEPHEDWECDNCGFVIWADENIEEFHYCPNCGADMRGEEA